MIEIQDNRQSFELTQLTRSQSTRHQESSQSAYYHQLGNLCSTVQESLYDGFDALKGTLIGSAFGIINLSGLGKSS